MNKERILELANLLEKQSIYLLDKKVKFNMTHCIEVDYNVSACIAGFTVLYFNRQILSVYNISDSHCDVTVLPHGIMKEAESILDLNNEQARDLFLPTGLLVEYKEFKKKDAVKVLRHFAETGKVDWSITGLTFNKKD